MFPITYDSANLQLAKNNKIYLIYNNQNVTSGGDINVSFGSYSNGNYNSFPLGIISNPNTWDTSSSPISNSIFLQSGMKNGYIFPQLIPNKDSCETNLIITDDVLNNSYDYQQASETIIASNIIFEGGNAEYHAGSSVTLTVGFNAKTESYFKAYILGCSDSSKASNNIHSYKEISETKKLLFYPNPTKNTLRINNLNNVVIKQVKVYNLLGKEVLQVQGNNENINVSGLLPGVYFVKLITQEGVRSFKMVKK